MAELSQEELKAHRTFGAKANNRGWALWESEEISHETASELLHAAHTAYYHWNVAGGPIHRGRADILLAYAYARVGSPSLSNEYAERARKIFDGNPEGIADWDRPFLLDVEGRIAALNGNAEESARLRNESRELGDAIADEGDKKVFVGTWEMYRPDEERPFA